MPTLGEFVHRAEQLGFKLRTIELLSPDGRERMRSLWRNRPTASGIIVIPMV